MPRTFSEQEIAAIIGRAVERQRAAARDATDEADGTSDADGAPAGLTLAELEEVGRAAGVDPAHLRAAADEVAAADAPGTEDAFVERWVDAPLTDAGWEDVVATLHTAPAPFGLPYDDGERPSVERIGRSYDWTRTEEITDTTTRVNVSPRGDRTRVRVWGSAASGASGPVSGALGTATVGFVAAWFVTLFFDGATILDATAIAAAVGAVLGSVAFLAMRSSGADTARLEAARVREIADAVAEAVADGAGVHAAEAERATEGGPAPAADRIDPGLLDPSPGAPSPETDRPRTGGLRTP